MSERFVIIYRRSYHFLDSCYSTHRSSKHTHTHTHNHYKTLGPSRPWSLKNCVDCIRTLVWMFSASLCGAASICVSLIIGLSLSVCVCVCVGVRNLFVRKFDSVVYRAYNFHWLCVCHCLCVCVRVCVCVCKHENVWLQVIRHKMHLYIYLISQGRTYGGAPLPYTQ